MKIYLRVALALLSAVLFWFSFGLTPFWAAAWVAPLPLLVAAYYSSRREAAILTWLRRELG